MRCKSLTRILALDLHPRSFGYVVLEGPDRLLDWGVRSYRRKGKRNDVLVQRRLRPLLGLWRPSLLLIRCSQQVRPVKEPLRGGLLQRLVAEARDHRVCVRVSEQQPGEQAENLTRIERAGV